MTLQATSRVQCREKTVVLDCCHSDRPKDTMLKSLVIYPPTDLYATIARQADCRVLGRECSSTGHSAG